MLFIGNINILFQLCFDLGNKKKVVTYPNNIVHITLYSIISW